MLKYNREQMKMVDKEVEVGKGMVQESLTRNWRIVFPNFGRGSV